MSDKKIVVEWKGKKIESYGDMWDAATKIRDPQEAEAFIQAHEKAGMKREIFLSNLGYWGGYYSHEARSKVYRVFHTSHPVFGERQPTAKEAFDAGKDLHKKLGRGRDR